METVETKELAVVRGQVTKAMDAANGLAIGTKEEMVAATDVLSRIKKVAKMARDRKEEITKPLNDALKSARDLFRPLEDGLAEAERIVKGKMVAWQATRIPE